ncbi:GYDIA family GHMP kinase [Joostella sp. CR20]|uniref:GYDIA family GHMP kinase n=1 Tax=Joostella sp. CR20 TaxID=2804312 RepID=UPI00313B8F80
MSEFYSHGKLLITSEYTVLDGATCLAIPTKLGQSLSIEEIDEHKIYWEAYNYENKCWFTATFNFNAENFKLEIDTTNTVLVAETLLKILKEANVLNPSFLKNTRGIKVKTHLEFPENWGLGSSSTLINNIASWAKVDAFQLLWNSFSGSGYDIACAQNSTPITYRVINKNPQIETVTFTPSFTEHLFFIHLNKKQNSREGIQRYREVTSEKDKQIAIEATTQLTKEILNASTLKTFEAILNTHENTISSILKLPTVKQALFSDFKGSIKSLGAWGGDFVLATGEASYVKSYFIEKGYQTIIPYQEMIA